jgi:DNA polymerase elongation subunit (family B)
MDSPNTRCAYKELVFSFDMFLPNIVIFNNLSPDTHVDSPEDYNLVNKFEVEDGIYKSIYYFDKREVNLGFLPMVIQQILDDRNYLKRTAHSMPNGVEKDKMNILCYEKKLIAQKIWKSYGSSSIDFHFLGCNPIDEIVYSYAKKLLKSTSETASNLVESSFLSCYYRDVDTFCIVVDYDKFQDGGLDVNKIVIEINKTLDIPFRVICDVFVDGLLGSHGNTA